MKSHALRIAAIASLTVLTSCLPEEDYESDDSSSTNFRRGSCTYTTDQTSDLYYQWGVVDAAWENYERRQIDGTYAQQAGAYNIYVQHYNYYSNLLEQYKASNNLPQNWGCTPQQLGGV